MHSAVRRTVLGAASATTLVVLLLALKPHHDPASAAQPPGQPVPSSAASGGGGGSVPSGSAGASDGAGASGTTSGASSGGRSAGPSGTYTGTPVTIRYGVVQVRATLRDGRLTGVQVLQAPSDNGRDRQIAADSLPMLTREALTAQSAHIDAVSGASYTSEGYIQSLQSALDRAHA